MIMQRALPPLDKVWKKVASSGGVNNWKLMQAKGGRNIGEVILDEVYGHTLSEEVRT